MEIVYSTFVLFLFFLTFFVSIKSFKNIKLILTFLQLILSFILLTNSFYKNHSLYKAPKFEYIQHTNFYPIKSLFPIYYENGTFKNIGFEKMNDDKFSLIKTDEYSTQCLENYFIKTNESCPITDIKFERKMKNEYHNYIKINNKEYLYYSKENKLGKLYKSFIYSDFKEKKEDTFIFDEKLIRKEYHKLSNPLLEFKYYIQFFDVICSLLIFIIFCLSFFEPLNNMKFNMTRIFNSFLQLIVLLIYIMRFNKFIKMKNFLFENDDIYKDESYIPNKVINVDAFPLAISINIIIYNLLYIFLKNKIDSNDNAHYNNINIKLLLIFPLILYLLILRIFDLMNDWKIVKIYNNIYYNWNLNPIKSINLTKRNNFKSENDIFKITKLYNLDYTKLLIPFNNSKICGKDNFDNNLYFPEEEDCPINEIFISKNDNDLPGYNKLKLNNSKYLYYTNQKIDEKIIVDLIFSSEPEIPLKSDKETFFNFTTFPFYENIDFDFDKKYLYAINYLGLNISSFSKNEVIKITNFKNRMNTYKIFSKTKKILFSIEIIFLLYILCYLNLDKIKFDKIKNNIEIDENNFFVCLDILILIKFVYYIILIICLDIQDKFIINFMNKINFDFQREKIDYKWNYFLLLFSFLFWIIIKIFLNIEEPFEYELSENIQSESLKINISNLFNIIKSFIRQDKLKERINNLEKEIEDKNSEIIRINNEKNIKELEISDLKRAIDSKNNQINLITNNNKQFLEIMNENKKIINGVKKNLPFELREEEKLLSVIIQSTDDQSIHLSIICKNTQVFNEVENLLFTRFQNYKDINVYFTCNGTLVNRHKTFEENNIKDGQVIFMTKYEFDS